MAVVLNDEVKSAAYIKSQIFDQGEISGRFSKESSRRSRTYAKIRSICPPRSNIRKSEPSAQASVQIRSEQA